MFHCNGWCFPWTVTAYAGTNVCLRAVSAKGIYDAIADHKVNYFCGAPIVLGIVVNAKDSDKRPFDHEVNVMTAGAAPPAAVLEAMEKAGFAVTHVYGLTETYGPAAECAWHEEWDALSDREREVLRLLALGHTNQEIARSLYISVRTAESPRAHIMQKRRLATRADLVRYALDRGLLET
jgi:fatty-acyl-CoA synthase